MLYATLYQFGFSDRPVSEHRTDGLELHDCRITNAVKCLPPENKPAGVEVRTCNRYLAVELQMLRSGAVVLALGSVAHSAVIRAFGLRQSSYRFGHGYRHALPGKRYLLDSYHCSRYNTQTGRLSEAMFHAVFRQARELLSE